MLSRVSSPCLGSDVIKYVTASPSPSVAVSAPKQGISFSAESVSLLAVGAKLREASVLTEHKNVSLFSPTENSNPVETSFAAGTKRNAETDAASISSPAATSFSPSISFPASSFGNDVILIFDTFVPMKFSKSSAVKLIEFSPTLVFTIFMDERITSSPGERVAAPIVSEIQNNRQSA